MDLVAKVERHIREERLLQEGEMIVVAVSGGPDSATLLHILCLLSEKWRWNLVVAHVDHRFRGEESEREARFVERWAESLGLPCEIGKIDVPAHMASSGKNAQVAARELRYAFLHRVAEQYGAQAIALAHHADDQAETMLMRLIQGTGPSGLVGIPVRRVEKKVELIRPLLRIYKSEIMQYCAERRLDYCVDSSNLERKYFRNRVRLDLMPQLQKLNPRIALSLNRLAEAMRAEDDYLAREADRVFAQIVTTSESACRFEKADFLKLHLALQRRLLRRVFGFVAGEPNPGDFTRIELIRSAVTREHPPNLSLDLGGGLRLTREYGTVTLRRERKAEPAAFDYPVADVPFALAIPEAGADVSFALLNGEAAKRGGAKFEDRGGSDREPASGQAVSGTFAAMFDYDRLCLPLSMRSRRPGDRMQLFGLNGSKKVKDIFIDAKVPPERRGAIPLLVDAAGRILWIPGLRRSAHALVTAQTERALLVRVTYQHETGRLPN